MIAITDASLREVGFGSALLAIGLMNAAAASASDAAHGYPVKPIRFIVPFAPGGGTDIVARLHANNISKRLGYNVVVDNRAGGAGTVGVDTTANAVADGYTICIISATNAINSAINPKLPYDLARDLQGVSQLTSAFLLLVVQASFPARSVSQLIDYARTNPGKLNFGSSGTGGHSHFAGAMFAQMARINLVHIPYRGEAAAITDLLGGQTQLQFSSLINANPHINSGRLRALGISSSKRSSTAPDLPTIAESGVPGYEVSQWYGVVTASKVPRAIINTLSGEFAKSAQSAEIVQRLKTDSVESVSSRPEVFGAHVRAEIDKWRKLIRDAGLQLQ
jgi:tripartite-type tricarboxylate transporter receptor subunit TctC